MAAGGAGRRAGRGQAGRSLKARLALALTLALAVSRELTQEHSLLPPARPLTRSSHKTPPRPPLCPPSPTWRHLPRPSLSLSLPHSQPSPVLQPCCPTVRRSTSACVFPPSCSLSPVTRPPRSPPCEGERLDGRGSPAPHALTPSLSLSPPRLVLFGAGEGALPEVRQGARAEEPPRQQAQGAPARFPPALRRSTVDSTRD